MCAHDAVSGQLVCVSCQPMKMVKSSTPKSPHFFQCRCHRASRRSRTYAKRVTQHVLCRTTLLSLGMLLTDSLRPSCGAKNGDRLWQTFILHCLFPFFLSFWCNSKWKR